MKFRVSIGVFMGDFRSQQTAFAHLFDAFPEADLEQVEVLARPFETRLAQYFRPGDTAFAQDAGGSMMVLTFPGSGIPLLATDRLRPLGRFPGVITRALIPEE